jgi:hypothetical protein
VSAPARRKRPNPTGAPQAQGSGGSGFYYGGAAAQTSLGAVDGAILVRKTAVPHPAGGGPEHFASRYLSKSADDAHWIEAGFVEDASDPNAEQLVYEYDTESNSYSFYSQYPLTRDGFYNWDQSISTLEVATAPYAVGWNNRYQLFSMYHP